MVCRYICPRSMGSAPGVEQEELSNFLYILYVDYNGLLRNKEASLYKRGTFTFFYWYWNPIITMQTIFCECYYFISSNITASPAYGVYISQLIRYSRACLFSGHSSDSKPKTTQTSLCYS